MTQPIISMLTCFILGILLQNKLNFPILALGCFTFVLCFLYIRCSNSLVCFCMAFILLGMLRYHSEQCHPAVLTKQECFVKLRGNLISPYYPCQWFPQISQNPKSVFAKNYMILEIKKIYLEQQWHTFSGTAKFTVDDFGEVWHRGDHLEVLGVIEKIPQATNPGEFDSHFFWSGKNVEYLFHANHRDNVRVISRNRGCCILNIFALYRVLCCEKIFNVLGKSQGSLAAAMFLGERRFLSFSTKQQFRNTGTMHIMAISGLHVSLLAGCFYIFLSCFPINYAWRCCFMLLFLWSYALLSGFQGPVVRASLMISLYLLAPLVARRPNPYNILGVAAFVILFFSPKQIFFAGFQLSFCACAFIFIMLPKNLKNDSLTRKITNLIAVAYAAFLGTAPLVALHFGSFFPLGSFIGLIITPFVALALVLTLLLLFTPLGFLGWFATLNSIVWETIVTLMHVFSTYSFFYNVIPPLVFIVLLGYSLFLLYYFFYKTKGIYWTATLICFCVIFSGGLRQFFVETGDIVVLDVGHGSMTYINLPGNRHMLYDCGSKNPYAGQKILVPFLRSRGIAHLHAVVISHFDSDHYNALPTIIEHITIRRVYLNLACWRRGQNLVRMLQEKNIQIYIVTDKEMVEEIPEVEFIYPGQYFQDYAEDNNHSLMVLLSLKHRKILFTGDIEDLAWKVSKEKEFPKIDVLQVPHHGANNDFTSQLIHKCNPDIAFISSSKKFVSQSILNKYELAGVTVEQTSLHGAISFYFDNKLRCEHFLHR